jgi:hypothetical protein
MREGKNKRHPANEEHAKEKGYPCAESGISRREYLAQKARCMPSRPARLSTTHTAPLGRLPSRAAEAEIKERKALREGRVYARKRSRSRICARKEENGTSTTEY